MLEAGTDLGPGAVVDHDAATVAFDTRDVVYAAPPDAGIDLDALNRDVIRFRAPAGARANPALGPATGRLGVPLLTLKGTGDLFTPISLDAAYARRVEAAGDRANLVQRAVRRAGHCDLSFAEGLAAVIDVTRWLDEGLAPAGEDLTGDLRAAGVAFTSPFDVDDPLG